MIFENETVLIRGGGDMATGVGVKLFKCGFPVVITEIERPLVVRRTVSFAQVIYEGECIVEGVKAKRVCGYDEVKDCIKCGEIPVIVDPKCAILDQLKPTILIDGTMVKNNIGTGIDDAKIVIGLGPGFTARKDVDAVIETESGHYLGSVIFEGAASLDTGIPCNIEGHALDRVFRAPCDGVLRNKVDIDDIVSLGQILCEVDGVLVKSQIAGVVRGILKDGLTVEQGLKLGDIDHRGDVKYNYVVSDKMRNIAGGVLEAIITLL